MCALDKWIQSKFKLSDFQLLACQLTKLLMSFFKPQVSFCLNFATPFSAMTLKIFNWNSVCFGQKQPISVQFSEFWVLYWKFTQFLMLFLKPQSQGLSKFCITGSVSWKMTPLYIFSSSLIYLGQKLLDFWVVGWKFTKLLMSYLKL